MLILKNAVDNSSSLHQPTLLSTLPWLYYARKFLLRKMELQITLLFVWGICWKSIYRNNRLFPLFPSGRGTIVSSSYWRTDCSSGFLKLLFVLERLTSRCSPFRIHHSSTTSQTLPNPNEVPALKEPLKSDHNNLTDVRFWLSPLEMLQRLCCLLLQ